MNLLRFYHPIASDAKRDYLCAIEKAFDLAKMDSNLKDFVIVGKSKSSLEIIKSIFGKAFSKMKSGYKFPDCPLVFRTESVRTFKSKCNQNSIILSCNLQSTDLFYLEEFPCVKAVIAIARPLDIPERWIKIWRPAADLRRNEIIEPYGEPSCVSKIALASLTKILDLSQEFNAYSRRLIKSYLLLLKQREQVLPGDAVAFLIRDQHWSYKSAKFVGDMISILQLQRATLSSKSSQKVLEAEYDLWKQQCDEIGLL